MLAYGPSPRKISNPFSDWIGRLCELPRKVAMPAILIVEDDVLANEHLEYILQQAGYEVLSATSADDALELLEDGADVRLIVTDINLPGTMNGLKLAAVAKAQRPEINFIIVTGYNAPKGDEIPPGSLFIPKPYDARKMMEAIRHFQSPPPLRWIATGPVSAWSVGYCSNIPFIKTGRSDRVRLQELDAPERANLMQRPPGDP